MAIARLNPVFDGCSGRNGRHGFRRAGGNDDAVLGSTLGSVEGGTFHFSAAHFELLTRMARQLGLDFADLGKRRFGTGATLHFCDELQRLYAHEDYQVAAAASWAIDFYRRNGFTVVEDSEKNRLLRAYWSIPARQIETSVVLADKGWVEAQQ